MIKKFLKIFFLTLFFALIFDFFLGNYLLKFTPKKISHTTAHSVYDHDLKSSFKSNLEWETGKKYKYCTDKNSFRSFCKDINSNLLEFDIAFIGDSFTEGIGLEYMDTFVGKISKHYHELRIANLGVVSYSPSIYYSKLKYLIENGYKFKRVIIYFDISDIYDDNRKYRLIDDKVSRKKSLILSNFQKLLKKSFPFLSYTTKTVKNDFLGNFFSQQKVINKCNYLDYCHEKSSWTFNNQYFGELEINKSLNIMNMIFELLNVNNISMSIGIYPWPAQILYDTKNSKVVKIFEEFCKTKCEFFFNNFPDFFSELKSKNKNFLISQYYIKNDVHFNELGNDKIFKNFINNFQY